uniref:striated muscle-specific serine/threonine-protein kinase-like n=1 Tax=Myxine glutinosa TaxID=7769 RepID=UPI00358F2C53
MNEMEMIHQQILKKATINPNLVGLAKVGGINLEDPSNRCFESTADVPWIPIEVSDQAKIQEKNHESCAGLSTAETLPGFAKEGLQFPATRKSTTSVDGLCGADPTQELLRCPDNQIKGMCPESLSSAVTAEADNVENGIFHANRVKCRNYKGSGISSANGGLCGSVDASKAFGAWGEDLVQIDWGHHGRRMLTGVIGSGSSLVRHPSLERLVVSAPASRTVSISNLTDEDSECFLDNRSHSPSSMIKKSPKKTLPPMILNNHSTGRPMACNILGSDIRKDDLKSTADEQMNCPTASNPWKKMECEGNELMDAATQVQPHVIAIKAKSPPIPCLNQKNKTPEQRKHAFLNCKDVKVLRKLHFSSWQSSRFSVTFQERLRKFEQADAGRKQSLYKSCSVDVLPTAFSKEKTFAQISSSPTKYKESGSNSHLKARTSPPVEVEKASADDRNNNGKIENKIVEELEKIRENIVSKEWGSSSLKDPSSHNSPINSGSVYEDRNRKCLDDEVMSATFSSHDGCEGMSSHGIGDNIRLGMCESTDGNLSKENVNDHDRITNKFNDESCKEESSMLEMVTASEGKLERITPDKDVRCENQTGPDANNETETFPTNISEKKSLSSKDTNFDETFGGGTTICKEKQMFEEDKMEDFGTICSCIKNTLSEQTEMDMSTSEFKCCSLKTKETESFEPSTGEKLSDTSERLIAGLSSEDSRTKFGATDDASVSNKSIEVEEEDLSNHSHNDIVAVKTHNVVDLEKHVSETGNTESEVETRFPDPNRTIESNLDSTDMESHPITPGDNSVEHRHPRDPESDEEDSTEMDCRESGIDNQVGREMEDSVKENCNEEEEDSDCTSLEQFLLSEDSSSEIQTTGRDSLRNVSDLSDQEYSSYCAQDSDEPSGDSAIVEDKISTQERPTDNYPQPNMQGIKAEQEQTSECGNLLEFLAPEGDFVEPSKMNEQEINKQSAEPENIQQYELNQFTSSNTCQGCVSIDDPPASTKSHPTDPVFSQPLRPITVPAGWPVRLECEVQSPSDVEVDWLCDDQILPPALLGCEMLFKGRRCMLSLAAAHEDDSGTYSCRLTSSTGEGSTNAKLTVLPAPQPLFTQPLVPTRTVLGSLARLDCRVSGNPTPVVSWFHEGTLIVPGERLRINRDRGLHSLLIGRVNSSDEGEYEVVARNRHGEACCQTELSVEELRTPGGSTASRVRRMPPIAEEGEEFEEQDESENSEESEDVEESEESGKFERPEEYEKSEEPDDLANLEEYEVSEESNKIESFDESEVTTIKCMDFLQPISDVRVVEGKRATFECRVSGPPWPQVAWYHLGHQLEPSKHIIMIRNDDICQLHLNPVTSHDAGVYECVISRGTENVTCSARLNITGLISRPSRAGNTINLPEKEPPHFQDIMEDVTVSVGETARFVVSVNGNPPFKVTWYKDADQLVEGDHIRLLSEGNEHALIIPHVVEADPGVYSCRVCNLAGESVCKAQLNMNAATCSKGGKGEQKMNKIRRMVEEYDVKREIGRGVFATVRLVMARSNGEEFAAKYIPFYNTRRAVPLRELQILRRLSPHLRLSSLRDAFQTPGSLLIILSDLCYEEMLDRLLKKTEYSESDVIIYIRQLLEGLAYIHGCDVMHLDIKPSNILMARPTGDNIKICDFGFAQQVIPGHSQHSCFGFPEFAAPEITLNLPVSTATDLWPVGVLTYLCLHGATPFVGETDRATLQNVLRGWSCLKRQQAKLSTASRDFIHQLLAQEKTGRPSAEECLNHPWLQVSSTSSTRVTSQDRLRSFLSRTRWQCSLISHKSQMTMRPLPGLLAAPPGQQSVGVPRHLVDLTMPSSASDSDWEEATACHLPLPSLECKGVSGSSTCHDSEGKGHIITDSVNVQAKNQDEVLMKTTSINQARENGSCNEEQDEKLESPPFVSAQVRRRGLMGRKRSFDLDTPNSSSDEELSGGRSAVESHRPRRRGQSYSRIENGNSSTKTSVKALPTNTNMVAPRRTNASRRRTEIKMHVQPMQWEDNRELVRSLSVESHLEKLNSRRLEIPGASTTVPENIPPDETERASSCTAINIMGVQFPNANSGCYGSLENSRRYRDLLNTGLAETNVWENKNMPGDASVDIQTDIKDVPSMIPQSSNMPLPPEGTSPDIIFAHSPVSSQTKKTMSSTSQTSVQGSAALCPQKHDYTERNERSSPLQHKSPLYSDAVETIQSPDHEIAKATTVSTNDETLLVTSDTCNEIAAGETLEPLALRVEEEEVRLIEECAKSEMAKTVQAQGNNEISASSPTSNSKEIDSQSETNLCVPDAKSPMNNTSSPMKNSPKSPSKEILSRVDEKNLTSPAQTVLRKSVSVPCLGRPLEKTVSTPENIKSFHTLTLSNNNKEQAIRNGSTLSLPNDPGRYRAQQLKLGSHREHKVRIENIDSEEIFETEFKRKTESSLLRHFPFLKRTKSEERISTRSSGIKEEVIYRPRQKGTPIEPSPDDAFQGPPFDELDVLEGRVVSKSPTISENVETGINVNIEASGLVCGTSESKPPMMTNIPRDTVPTCGKATPGHDDNLASQQPLGFMRRLSSSLQKIGSKEVLNQENINIVKNEEPHRETFTKSFSQLPMASSILRRIEAKVLGLSVLRGPTLSEERLERPFGVSSLSRDVQSSPAEKLAARTLKRATSEIVLPKKPSFFQKMIHKMENKVTTTSPTESSSQYPPAHETEPDRRSRWERWGLSRSSRKDGNKKSADTHPNLQAGPSHTEGLPPRFPLELRDENVIDSHPITLQCLPDGVPFPDICWLKDGEPLHTDSRVRISCAPDGRHILTILGSTDGDAGRYQCVATNCAGRAASTCCVTLASESILQKFDRPQGANPISNQASAMMAA